MTSFQVQDYLYEVFDLSNYSLLLDIFLAVAIYVAYINSLNWQSLAIAFLGFCIIRFFVSKATTLTNESNKKYFQTSAKVALFAMLMNCLLEKEILSTWLAYCIILSYSVLNVLSRSNFTYDTLSTLSFVFVYHTIGKNFKLF